MTAQPAHDDRPLPVPTPLSAPHWEGCRRGELLVQRCERCSAYVFPPEETCTACRASDLGWVTSSGRGRVHTYTVVWRAQQPAFQTPYVPIVVEMEEGWHLISNLVDCDPQDVAVGMEVEVVFQRQSEEITLPMFRPCARGPVR